MTNNSYDKQFMHYTTGPNHALHWWIFLEYSIYTLSKRKLHIEIGCKSNQNLSVTMAITVNGFAIFVFVLHLSITKGFKTYVFGTHWCKHLSWFIVPRTITRLQYFKDKRHSHWIWVFDGYNILFLLKQLAWMVF